MLLVEFFRWWYGSGWLGAWKSIGHSIKNVQMEFAIPVLIRSLFAPWKQIVSLPGRSLDEKFRSFIDNLVSRTIGFFVRLGTLLVAGAVIALSVIAGLAITLAWPLLPLLVAYCLIRTITG